MKKKWKITIIIAIILIILCVFIFATLNKIENETDKLTGLWNVDGNTKYEFDGTGNGKIIVANSEFEFIYVINDNIVSVDFKNEKSRDTEYMFKVSENELELNDLNQPDVNLKLTKEEN